LTSVSSSILDNLWPLARISDHGLIPASQSQRVDLGMLYILAAFFIFFIFPDFNAVMAICMLDSFDKGIL
jgi:hypothetical protein